MKILILQNGWSGQGISGGDKHLIDVATFWKQQHQLTILLPENGKNFLQENFGPEIVDLNLKKSWEIWPFKVLRSLALILLAYFQRTIGSTFQLGLIDWKFDVTISGSHFFYDLFPLLIFKLKSRSKLVVYVFHLLNYQEHRAGLRNYISLLSEHLSLFLVKRFADAVLTDNRETYTQLVKEGLKSSKLHLIRVGIRQPPADPGLKKEYGLCFLGRLVKQKGIEDLIEVFSILRIKNLDLSLVIMGSGDEETPLKQSLHQKGLSGGVVFLGAVDESTKYKILRRSKIFVSPSYEEGWGMALGEALACGIPAVVYDLTVLQEVYKEAPIFVTPGNREAMAQAIQKLLSDNDYYRQKVRQGLAVVSDYYLEPLAVKELSFLENL